MTIEIEKIKDVLTSGDVARICNVASRTAQKWIDNGSLKGYRVPGSKDRRVTKASLIEFMQANNMPIHISSKRNVILFGFPKDSAAIVKKLAEEDFGINIHIVNDIFTAGFLMGEKHPNLVLVDGSDLEIVMPMLKAMDFSTAEVVVAIDDPVRLCGLNVSVLNTPYRVKDVIEAITKHI